MKVDLPVLARQDEQRHERLPQIVEVIAVVDPPVPRVHGAVGTSGDIIELGTDAVEHHPLEELNAQDAEDDEEGAADQHNVTDGL